MSLILLGLGTATAAYFTLTGGWYRMEVDDTFSLTSVSVPDSGPLGAFGWEKWPLILTLLAAVFVMVLLLTGWAPKLLRPASFVLSALSMISAAVLVWRLIDQPDLVSHVTPRFDDEFKRHYMDVTVSYARGSASYLLLLAGALSLSRSWQSPPIHAPGSVQVA